MIHRHPHPWPKLSSGKFGDTSAYQRQSPPTVVPKWQAQCGKIFTRNWGSDFEFQPSITRKLTDFRTEWGGSCRKVRVFTNEVGNKKMGKEQREEKIKEATVGGDYDKGVPELAKVLYFRRNAEQQ